MKKDMRKNSIMPKLSALFQCMVLGGMSIATDALAAQTLGQRATAIKGDLASVPDLLGLGSLILGIGFGIATWLKFNQYSKSHGQGQVTLGSVFALAVVSIALVGLGGVLGTGAQTLFGSTSGVIDQSGNISIR